ncbi:MAG TPA: sugar MFS transporter [Rhizomicrobium sp.]|jgi:FHS family L-fucose permease-like MFS transporter|nr:sugar MFS transporter [Rhizomicrobium sp.]
MEPSESLTANGTAPRAQQRLLIGLVVLLFFAWGFATVLLDTLVPKLKGVFALSYTEVMLIQFSFFIGYFFFSIPAGFILSRIGYIRSAILGLAVMICGCLLFSPAAASGVFAAFLFALFVMAAGITVLQVVANPFIAELGPVESSHSRLTLAQAFNSLATAIGPYVGAVLILRTGVTIDAAHLSPQALAAARIVQAHAVQLPFLVIAACLAIVAVLFWFMRRSAAPPVSAQMASFSAVWALRNKPRLLLGALAIFLYVGAEVSIGSMMTNYLMQSSVLGFSPERAGKLVSLYWGGAMIGRFVGAFVLQRVRPGALLAVHAVCAGALAILSALSTGPVAAWSLIAVGLFNSIMFPTIFTLASENMGEETPNASALLVMAIVGGAIMPEVTGAVADHASLAAALAVPAICYVWILIYGILTARGLGVPAKST